MSHLALPPAFANRLLAAASVDVPLPDLLSVEAPMIALEPRIAERVETARYYEPLLLTWTDDDPLGDAWLALLGAYPTSAEGVALTERHLALLHRHRGYISVSYTPTSDDALGPSPINMTARRLEWDCPAGCTRTGVFVGDVADWDDLVAYWNLRAADLDVVMFAPHTPSESRRSSASTSRWASGAWHGPATAA